MKGPMGPHARPHACWPKRWAAALVDDGAEDRKKFGPCPVAGRTASGNKSGSAQNKRTGADRSQVTRGRSKPGDLFDESIVLDDVDAATASRHQKDVTRFDDRQVFQI